MQASFTFLPAGTVIFSIWSTNSGSSVCPETKTQIFSNQIRVAVVAMCGDVVFNTSRNDLVFYDGLCGENIWRLTRMWVQMVFAKLTLGKEHE